MDAIEPHGRPLPLYPGEKVLWTGAPGRHRPPIGTGLLISSGMALVGLLFMGPPLLATFDPSLLVFLVVWEGIVISTGPLRWVREWRRNRTVRYAATDRRVLVTFHSRGPQSASYEYQRLGPPQAVRGGIRMEWLGAPGRAVELSDIPDALIVQDLITQAQARTG